MTSSPQGRPFRYFVLALFVASLTAFAFLYLVANSVLTRSALDREADVTAATIGIIVDDHLGSALFRSAVTNGGNDVFNHLGRHIRRIPEVIHFHVYDAQRKKVWCENPEQVGKIISGNEALERALHGKVEVELGKEKPAHAYIPPEFDPHNILEVYTPLKDSGGDPYAVVALYKYPEKLLDDFKWARLLLGSISGSIGLLLFVTLAGIYWRAQRIERGLTMRARDAENQLIQGEKLRVVGEMAATIAHELNNPLGVLMGKVREMGAHAQEGGCAVGCRANIDVLYREIGRLREVSRNLLLLTRKSELKREPVNLNSVLRDVADFVRPSFERTNVAIVEELEVGLPQVLADANQLKQVFLNLLQNAKDAMRDGGTIHLRTRREVVHVVAEVADTGSGIPADVIERIFDPFFSTKPQREGSGLGLSISSSIVQGYGGVIEARSTPGQGSTFRVVLPASEGD